MITKWNVSVGMIVFQVTFVYMADGPPSPETVCCWDVYRLVSSEDQFRTIVSMDASRVKKLKKKLISRRDHLRQRVEEINGRERVSDEVWEWLKDVEKLLQKVEDLETDTLTHSNCCFLCTVPKVKVPKSARERRMTWWNYNKMLKEMKLNDERKFESIFTPIPSLEHFASRDFMCFESTKEASDQLLEALNDGSSYMIGLYGKRGSGKTTLVKAMGVKSKYLRIFDVVLFATVSKNPYVRMIQNEIAEPLNLRFERDAEVGRAKTIYSTLESIGKVLVILDDVREKLELENIGINPCNANKCKVLLTTRHRQECALMNCQRVINLGPLSKEETWTLLKKHSSIDDDESSSDLENVAREVANECKGLPGAIKDVVYCLKSKSIEEWRALLDSMRHSIARNQIFLSFRGEDTRYSFTGSLYHALCYGGFKTFMDEELRSGDQISLTILKAIEESRLSIIVLSENYADSSWCLDELVKILECMKMYNQMVWPIFYKVEPSDIRIQKNSYGKALDKHVKRYGNDSQKIQKWRSALFEIANLSGKTFKTGYVVCFQIIIFLLDVLLCCSSFGQA
ncbi:putative disease resistance protein At5g05400 [Abrus precatorius]|uniref:Disease resistance protein At5g05400 n=1 Tax=Abrus precatorius TaxID=3816 RepID=A0A8B8KVD2_ABRPR|nr:putative disease resistance protein At5g05400 [Abrus precatorius]